MRKILSVFLIFTVLATFVSCKQETNIQKTQKTPVTINSPKDDTVNGYRLNEIKNSDNNQNDVKESTYCGNINSKIFHYSDCKSVSKMKEENKYFSKDKQHLIELGFTPCNNCKP